MIEHHHPEEYIKIIIDQFYFLKECKKLKKEKESDTLEIYVFMQELRKRYGRRGFSYSTIIEFMNDLHKVPVHKIPIFAGLTGDELDICKKYPLFYQGNLHPAWEQWYEGITIAGGLQEQRMKAFIERCRTYHLQDFYVKVRMFLILHPYVSESKLDVFVEELQRELYAFPKEQKQIFQQFSNEIKTNFYHLCLEKEVYLCPSCGYPKKFNQNHEWQCEEIFYCQHRISSKLVEVEKAVATKNFSKASHKNQSFYKLDKKMYKFITIPGLFELDVFNKYSNKKEWEVHLYPELERKGDLLLIHRQTKRTFYLDCKQHQNTEFLLATLEKNPHAKDTWIVVPPLLWKYQKTSLRQQGYEAYSLNSLTVALNKAVREEQYA